MSKQLTLSATFAVLSMAAFAMLASINEFDGAQSSQVAAKAPLIEGFVGR